MKVLILTSYITGHGHASITSALEDALRKRGIDFKSVEAYEMCSKTWLRRAKNYGKTTRKHPKMWEFYFNLSVRFPELVGHILERSCRKKFLKIYNEYSPDAVISNHPMFVKSILNIMEKEKLPARFIPVIADLISITPLWIDRRSYLTVAPTMEAFAYALRRGADYDKVKVINLPTRAMITERAKTVTEEGRKNDGFIKLLMMSGAEGSGDMASNIRELLKIENAVVTVIAGRNAKLEKSLRDEFGDDERVEVYGFVKNIDELMVRQDIAIVRGSPNVLMECVNLALPVIITGYLGGQEPGNVDFIITRELGLFCPDTNKLKKSVDRYLQNDRELLKTVRKNQFAARDLDAAGKIADLL